MDLGASREVFLCPDQLSFLSAGLPWLVPRLKHAKALRITSSSTFNPHAVRLPQNEIASRLQRASCNLPGLQVLVRHLSNAHSAWCCCKPEDCQASVMHSMLHGGCRTSEMKGKPMHGCMLHLCKYVKREER